MKKTIFILFILVSFSYANYNYNQNNSGKIDMHGGKGTNLLGDKKGFSKSNNFNSLGIISNSKDNKNKTKKIIKKEEKE